VWSVFDRDARIVLAISEGAGLFNFTRLPADPVDPVECDYATIQCFDVRAEPELLSLVFRSASLEELFDRLRVKGYRVTEGHPNTLRVARL
jgi:hypothetical protein